MAHLDRNKPICGHDPLLIRKLLKEAYAPYSIRSEFIAHRLKISEAKAKLLAKCLVSEGYLEIYRNAPRDRAQYYQTAPRGYHLTTAIALRPIVRTTATRLLSQFVVRADQLTRLTHLVYTVQEAWVFGSFLSGKDRLSDVDIFIRIGPRYADQEVQNRERELRIEEIAKERRFGNFSERLSSAYYEVLRFLKARNGYYHFTDLTDTDNEALFERSDKRRLYPVSEIDLSRS